MSNNHRRLVFGESARGKIASLETPTRFLNETRKEADYFVFGFKYKVFSSLVALLLGF